MRMTLLRPKRSARMPDVGETTRAKREVQAVMSDLSRVVRGREESEVPMETRVAEITPVSSIGRNVTFVSLLFALQKRII